MIYIFFSFSIFSNPIILNNWFYCYSLDFEPSKTSSCDWKPWSLESIKNDRNKRNVVWLKVKIPQIDLKDPVIFFDSIDLNYELYIENKLYHQYGKFDKNFNVIFDGWPLHIIPITKEFSNKILYLKVYSIYEYPDIGIWKKQWIIERADLYFYILKDSFSVLIISLIFYFSSLLAFGIYIANQKFIFNLYFSIVALLIGNYLFFSPENLLLLLLFCYPLIYFTIDYTSIHLLIIFFSLYLQSVLELRKKEMLYLALNYIRYLFYIVFFLGIYLIVFDINRYFYLHYYVNVIIVIINLFFLIIIFIKIFNKDINAIYIFIGCLSISATGLIELANYFEVFKFFNIFHLGGLIFLLTNYIVLSNKYWATFKQLEITNQLLQQKQDQIEKIQRLKDNFILEITSKITTPLKDILTLIKQYFAQDSEKELLYRILDNFKREIFRINSLLSFERDQADFSSNRINIIEFLKNIHQLELTSLENKKIEILDQINAKDIRIDFNYEMLTQIFDELFFYSSGNVRISIDLESLDENYFLVIKVDSENVYMYPEIENFFTPYLKLNFLETTGLYLIYIYMNYFAGKFLYYIDDKSIEFILKFPLKNSIEKLKDQSETLLEFNNKKIFTSKSFTKNNKPKILFLYDDILTLKNFCKLLEKDYHIFCTNDLSLAEIQLKSGYDIFIFPPILYGNSLLSFFKKIRSLYDPFSLITILISPEGLLSWKDKINLGIQDIFIINKNQWNEEEIRLRIQNSLLLKDYYKKYLNYLKYHHDVVALGEIQNHFYKDYNQYKDYVEYEVKYFATDEISGDLVDVYKISDKMLLFIIADVTGHGLYPAFFSVFLRISMDLFIREKPNINGKELLEKINRMILKYFNKQLVTLSMVFVDIENQLLKFYRAGHLPALFYDSYRNQFLEIFPKGKILGVVESAFWEEIVINYHVGDRIFLYTDGLVESISMDYTKNIVEFIKKYNKILSIKELSEKIFVESIKLKTNSNKERFIEDDISTIFIELK